MNPPRATYRLQFNRALTFADAARLAPYLAALGISHVYASPWLKARAGSTHGYDIVDYNAFNPELGGATGFRRLAAALHRAGLGHILDFVPNHMGVAKADNAWWLDVLEWGRASPFAKYFDIDWNRHAADARGRLTLPFLGGPLAGVLAAGELVPRFDAAHGTFALHYHEHRFPLAPHTYAPLLRAAIGDTRAAATLEALARRAARLRPAPGTDARAVARLRARAASLKLALHRARTLHAGLQRAANALATTPAGHGALQPLLDAQHWRLLDWRRAAHDVNYRRFFDVAELAAVRVEDREVFARMHRLVGRLLAAGTIDGLRIDHIDGLYDPLQYLRRLRRLGGADWYLVVEKILAPDERLRARWPVAGTTGYDFLDQVTGLLVDARAESALTCTYRRFIGRDRAFAAIVREAKREVTRGPFAGQWQALARELHALLRYAPRLAACGVADCARVLEAIAAAFPVYRTYVDPHGAGAEDRRVIACAVADARQHLPRAYARLLDFTGAALQGAPPRGAATRAHRAMLRWALRFQQFTAPVVAKGCEDTAFYRYQRLLALDEVGADPQQFGLAVATFHQRNLERCRAWPHAMLASATHDTKRGEDVRARIATLSWIPREWGRAVRAWARCNRAHKRRLGHRTAPDRNDEYLLYQTLVGAWPATLTAARWSRAAAGTFTARIQAFMTKAQREAGQHTSWIEPDAAYEQATAEFVARILDRDAGAAFLAAFLPLQARVAALGVCASLAQLALKLTCPGVPDIYQGCELWDLHLVDPDNRQPVDFDRRTRLLQKVRAVAALAPAQRARRVRAWLAHWQDGAIKLFVLHVLLQLRARQPELFAHGRYQALATRGVPERSVAFLRTHGASRSITWVELGDRDGQPRHAAIGAPGFACVEVLSGVAANADEPLPPPSSMLGLPVAVWVAVQGTSRAPGFSSSRPAPG